MRGECRAVKRILSPSEQNSDGLGGELGNQYRRRRIDQPHARVWIGSGSLDEAPPALPSLTPCRTCSHRLHRLQQHRNAFVSFRATIRTNETNLSSGYDNPLFGTENHLCVPNAALPI